MQNKRSDQGKNVISYTSDFPVNPNAHIMRSQHYRILNPIACLALNLA